MSGDTLSRLADGINTTHNNNSGLEELNNAPIFLSRFAADHEELSRFRGESKDDDPLHVTLLPSGWSTSYFKGVSITKGDFNS